MKHRILIGINQKLYCHVQSPKTRPLFASWMRSYLTDRVVIRAEYQSPTVCNNSAFRFAPTEYPTLLRSNRANLTTSGAHSPPPMSSWRIELFLPTRITISLPRTSLSALATSVGWRSLPRRFQSHPQLRSRYLSRIVCNSR